MSARCPDAEQLLRLTLADSLAPHDADVREHVSECEACQETMCHLRETVDAVRRATPNAAVATPDCLDEERVAAFAAGTMDPAEGRAQLAHLIDCARCRRQVASVARLLRDPSVASEMELLATRTPTVRSRRLRMIGAAAGVAAAAVLLLLVGRTDAPHADGAPTYRERSVTGAVPPVALTPKGMAAVVDSFRWTSVPRADRYRLTVFDRDGAVQWEADTRDTALAIPPQLTRPVGATHLWRVEARVGWEDRWAASELAEFTLRPSPAR